MKEKVPGKKMLKKGKGRKGQKGTNSRLTAQQGMLLEYLLQPENRHKTVTEICASLKINRKVYYRAMENPRFLDQYTKMSIALTKHAVGPVVNAVIREAKRGSLGHEELVLEMAGVIERKGKGQVDIEADRDGNIKVRVDLL